MKSSLSSLVALAFFFSITERSCEGAEKVEMSICTENYNFTAFPNVFNHTDQDKAIAHMSTFSPLIATFCWDDLLWFTCLVHFPAHNSSTSTVSKPPCRSLCEEVYNGCRYAIEQLQFKWPEAISCEKFPNTSSACYADDPRERQHEPLVLGKECSATIQPPMCPKIMTTKSSQSGRIFTTVNVPFTNYFRHNSQDQAIYELSKHGALVNLLITLRSSLKVQSQKDSVSTCVKELQYLLCTLYVPRCGERLPEQYSITEGRCNSTISVACKLSLALLRNEGYNVKWPPVVVNCSVFSRKALRGNESSANFRQPSFAGLSPPPPSVKLTKSGPNFLDITWKRFPSNFTFGLAHTAIFFKPTALKTQYNSTSFKIETVNARIPSLKRDVMYDVFVSTVNNQTRYPGAFSKLQLETIDAIETPAFCSEFYNFTSFPNVFGHKNEVDAMFHMHTFFPLFDTMCTSKLKALMCSAFLPRYDSSNKVVQKPCLSLCKDVFDRCAYARDKIKFKWPKELECEKLPQESSACYKSPRSVIKSIPFEGDREGSIPECVETEEQSICSFLRSGSRNQPYFGVVHKSFRNYFNHTSQKQAVYELSKHGKLLSILSWFIDPNSERDAVTRCIQELSIRLCSLHLPRCNTDSPYGMTQSQCTQLFYDPNTMCSTVLRDARNRGYFITWPPVQVNCSLFPSRTGLFNGKYEAIPFVNSIPPPPSVVYTTINSSTITLRWQRYPLSATRRNAPRIELLYRPANSETTYTHTHTKIGSLAQIITDFTPKTNYEVLVAALDDKLRVPGRFEKLIYEPNTTIYEIPYPLEDCLKYYRLTIFPNIFGDTSLDKARERFYSYFPLVHTFCSEELTPFFCSVLLPRFNHSFNSVTNARQLPCRSSCERVYSSCSYAIKRSKFFWPAELKCDKFDNGVSCYAQIDFNEPLPVSSVLPQCKRIIPNPICSSVEPFIEEPQRRRRATSASGRTKIFTSTFSIGQLNYFNHTSTDEALYELSRYLPLISALRWAARGNERFDTCANRLIVILCHLHVPVCPLNKQLITRLSCRETLSNSSDCHFAITQLKNTRPNFVWPPVQVNCLDVNWFSNTTSRKRLTHTINRQSLLSLPPPPPQSIRFDPFGSSAYHRTLLFQRLIGSNFFTALLYRQNGSALPYTVQQTPSTRLTVGKLAPATVYEFHLATLKDRTGFPGPFEIFVGNTYGLCPYETTGENVTQGVFVWNAQSGRSISNVDCPYGSSLGDDDDDDDIDRKRRDNDGDIGFKGEGDGFIPFLLGNSARRTCNCNDTSCIKPFWGEPNTDSCNYKTFDNSSNITQELSNLLQMLVKGEKPVANVSEELVDLTLHAPAFQPDDVILTVMTLEHIFDDTTQLNKTGSNIVKTVDNILNTPTDVLGESQRNSKASTRALLLLEKYLNTPSIGTVSQNEQNLAVHSEEIDPKNFQGAGAASINELQNPKNKSDFVVYENEISVRPLISQVSLTLPKSIFENLDITSKAQNQRVVFIVHRKTLFFQSLTKNSSDSDAETERKKNSFVVAGSVRNSKLKDLKDPVVSTYRPLEKGIDETTACVFWDFTLDKGLGDWSGVGCTYKGIKDGVVTCHCNHLTNFAILMDVYIGDHNEDAHDKALSIISYIGCAVSLVGLILTIITVLIFKELRSKVPTQILLNFCIALSLTLIVFLAAAERSNTSSLASCRAGAIALHYFVLAVFVWMGIQAFNMYLAFVKVMPKHRSHFFLKCCLVGWGLPAVIVIITAASAIEDYGDETFCRLQGLPFQLAFLAPALLILAANTIAFFLIFRSLLTSGTKVTTDKRVSGLQQARRGAAILVVLGLTWIFGIFAVKDAKLVFQYLFCIFNSIQGLLVFIFYCVLSVETRTKYKRLFRGNGKGKESDTTGHHRYHGSTTDSKFHEIRPNKDTLSNTYTETTHSKTSTVPVSQTKNATDVELTSISVKT